GPAGRLGEPKRRGYPGRRAGGHARQGPSPPSELVRRHSCRPLASRKCRESLGLPGIVTYMSGLALSRCTRVRGKVRERRAELSWDSDARRAAESLPPPLLWSGAGLGSQPEVWAARAARIPAKWGAPSFSSSALIAASASAALMHPASSTIFSLPRLFSRHSWR